MKMDLETLCRRVEAAVPTARATAIPEATQIVVTFTNRPDVEVALLTPYLQAQIKKQQMHDEDMFALITSLVSIAKR